MGSLRRSLDTYRWDRIHRAHQRASDLPLSWEQIHRYVETLNGEEADLAERVAFDASHLHRFEHSVHSQNGEDGIIDEIFNRIGVTNRTFIEIGAADGEENCTAALVDQGWSGTWLEGDAHKAAAARSRVENRPVTVMQSFVDRESVLSVLGEAGAPSNPDLLVIDIDGNDYWIWQQVASNIRPRVVVIEYNAVVGDQLHWTLPYDADHRWNETCRHGAGLAALAALGSELGYTLVGCDSCGINAFFVSTPEAAPFARRPIAEHYVGPRYGLPYGHPHRVPVPFDAQPLPPADPESVILAVNPPWPTMVRSGGLVFVHLSVENRSSTPIGYPTISSVPTQLGSWWVDDRGLQLDGDPERSVQAWRADPGRSAELVGRATAPAVEGVYTLVFGLVQESVRWLGSPAVSPVGTVKVGPCIPSSG
jgi:hypothetical protein